MRSQQINWRFCQIHSDQLLAEGMFALQTQHPLKMYGQVFSNQPGNYLISLDDSPLYIGEAKNITARIKQQFKPKTSTFYKNAVRAGFGHIAIDKFLVQYIATNIGRKEIEEFGIVNLPTKLNKFQQGKRALATHANISDLWLEVQSRSNELLLQGEDELATQVCVPWHEASVPFDAGVYIVRIDSSGEIVYIGESSDIGERYKIHRSCTYFSALRRHIGTKFLGFTLKTINEKTRYFSENEDDKVNEFLHDCKIAFLPVSFGRFELERFLIQKNHPILNRKDNGLVC